MSTKAPYQVYIQHFANRMRAARSGKWKLVKSHIDRPLELYDLDADPAEIHNLSEQYPEVVERLDAASKHWKKEVYTDCPYDLDDFIERLETHGLVTPESTHVMKEGY